VPAQRAAIRLAAPASAQPDVADFADFVRSSQAKMVRLAELLTGDRGRAEDLAQDGYAKAYAAWARIRGGDPQAYVRRCIVNAQTDWWRRRTWREQPRPLVPDQPERADMTACLKQGSRGQHITFAVINVQPGPTGEGGPVVAWIECARSPVPRYPIVTPKSSGPP
jgi:hypothetical protein